MVFNSTLIKPLTQYLEEHAKASVLSVTIVLLIAAVTGPQHALEYKCHTVSDPSAGSWARPAGGAAAIRARIVRTPIR
ncbi:hypothetical protein EVAR_37457_1 [Eumeta japonica]|uniref:Uncharacterized protein n=1 Tax=Eumeta variegata TaxID=151549 RepID=A0A4C1X438_EUMVA|nr:hypothetical protein EVAR_37457_1 [Eumeta japonica]